MKIKLAVLLIITSFSSITGGNSRTGDMVKEVPDTKLKEETDTKRKEIVKIARSLLGKDGAFLHMNGKTYPNDCSGMVRAVFDTVGINIYQHSAKYRNAGNGVAIIYKSFEDKTWKNPDKTPRPGDLIFFNNTHDQNKNGKWDDPLSHVSLVTGVEENGKTIVYIHHTNSGVRRYRMNLEKKGIYAEGGIKYNDFLRRRPPADKDRTKYLSSNFFYCYMNILGN